MKKYYRVSRRTSAWKHMDSSTIVIVSESDRTAQCFSCGVDLLPHTKRVEASAYCYNDRKFCKKCVVEGSERVQIDKVQRNVYKREEDEETFTFMSWTVPERVACNEGSYLSFPMKTVSYKVRCKSCGRQMPIGTTRIKFDIYNQNEKSHAWVGICEPCFISIKNIL